MTTELSTHDLMLKALEATKVCRDEDCDGTTHPRDGLKVSPNVPILDAENEFGLRVECSGGDINGLHIRYRNEFAYEPGSLDYRCHLCQGRGWIPSNDISTWMGDLGSTVVTFTKYTDDEGETYFECELSEDFEKTGYGATHFDALIHAIWTEVEALAKAGE